jgi:hypothetical protein
MKIHEFTEQIISVLEKDFPGQGEAILEASPLLQYINEKTRSATSGSKSRSSFGNIYAIYVLVEDYIKKGFASGEDYKKYKGARFSDLLQRQRQLPFGSKIQNHPLNSRLNEEFKKFFLTLGQLPVMRDLKTERYWINENLLIAKTSVGSKNISNSIICIIDLYVKTKKSSFEQFISDCNLIYKTKERTIQQAASFILELLHPNVDARIFEIVSYAILKEHFSDVKIYWGWTPEVIKEESLVLYKTGRTNANDGGIDFVMRPLGRFFQVTETLDVKKYFLDIEKIQRYPLTFVIKSFESVENLRKMLENQARRIYQIDIIISRFMECIEEIINVPYLNNIVNNFKDKEKINNIIEEIIHQSRVEFNYESDESEPES